MLEEGSFRGRTADFLFMFIFGAALMTVSVMTVMQWLCLTCLFCYSKLGAVFVNLLFLGHAFTIMLVYVWSRRNPFVRLNFFGLLNFQAPYLPWVLLGFSLLLGNAVLVDLMGIIVGHIYYYLEDVFPYQAGGFRVLKTPSFIQSLFPDDRVNQRQEEQARLVPQEEHDN